MRSEAFTRFVSRLKSGWSFMRLLRLVLGLMAAVQAFLVADVVLGFLAIILLTQAVLNVGCCGAGACDTNQVWAKQKSPKAPLEDVTFKEVN